MKRDFVVGFFGRLFSGVKKGRWFFSIVAGFLLFVFGIIEFTGLFGLESLILYALSVRSAALSAVAGFIGVAGGALLLYYGIAQSIGSLIGLLAPEYQGKVIERMIQTWQLRKGPKIVAIGGGTGLSTLLRGIKDITCNITAIVTVTDDGGSSGRLRAEMGMPPPGDIRDCLVALANTEVLMEQLFQYRFKENTEFAGHSFGNLLIAALTEVTGDFEKAIKESSKVLNIRGVVLPSTLEDVIVGAEYDDGTFAEGESTIGNAEKRIRRIYIKPEDCDPLEEAVQAIENADAIILGPGSLYTSVLPNLMVRGITMAIRRSKAVKIYICNVMTQPGETDGYTAGDHVRAIIEHVGRGVMDYVLVNTAKVPQRLLEKYSKEGSVPVAVDRERIERFNLKLVEGELISERDLVRHDSHKLARAILRLILEARPGEERMTWLNSYFLGKMPLFRRRAADRETYHDESGAQNA